MRNQKKHLFMIGKGLIYVANDNFVYVYEYYILCLFLVYVTSMSMY